MIIVICVTAVIITALICFKGVTFNKRMEVIPPKVAECSMSNRPEELDEIEKKLNAINSINEEQARNDKAPVVDSYAPQGSAMDYVLKNIQDVFGPEIPRQVDNDQEVNKDGR